MLPDEDSEGPVPPFEPRLRAQWGHRIRRAPFLPQEKKARALSGAVESMGQGGGQ